MLVVDEVGPLELLGGRGWAGSLSVLRARAYRVALVVCRPHLVADLASTLGLRLGCPGPGPFTARIRPLSVETRETVEIAVVQEVLQLLRS
jgi:hypothetical protein